jgi:hypothetical protein
MDDNKKDKPLSEEEAEEKKKDELKGEKAKKFLEKMRKRYEREVKADKENRDAAADDQRFLMGGENQWSSDDVALRKILKRPCLTLDELNRPVNQLVGEMRLNKAHIKVIPSDAEGNMQIAKSRQAIIHGIEYDSEADAIYDYAGEMMASCGYGAWRILTRYCEDNPFLQEIYMQRIKNPLLVYPDSHATSQVYSDGKYLFILEKISNDDFEERYPSKKVPDVEDFKSRGGSSMELWFEEDAFWIADYYVVEEEEKTFCLMENDDILLEEEVKEKKKQWEEKQKEALEMKQMARMLTSAMPAQPPAGALGAPAQPGMGGSRLGLGSFSPVPSQPQPGMPTGPAPAMVPPTGGSPVPVVPKPMPDAVPPTPDFTMPPLPDSLKISKKATKKVPKVKHYAIAPDQILDGPNDIPGRYIPVIIVKGPEKNLDGKSITRSLIRNAKDPQRLLNWVETSKGELTAMLPHSPWIGTPEQIQPFDHFYQAANIQNYAWLPYKAQVLVDDNGNSHLIPPPTRVGVGTMPVQLFQYAADVRAYIEDAVGMSRSDTMASEDPSRTGAAVRGKRAPSDVGTFAFIDNLHRGITHGGRIINEMIPEVYDTPRDVRVMLGEEDQTLSFMPVNTPYAEAFKKIQKAPGRYTGIDPKELQPHVKDEPKSKYNDLSKGDYDVIIKVGPPFSTAREEAAEQMMIVATQGQKMNPVDKYFTVKNMNLADGGEYADTLRRMIPPHILPPKEGEPARPQPPVPPQMQLLMQKAKTEELKQNNAKIKEQNIMLQTKAKLLEMAKESDKTDKEVRRIALQAISDVFSPGGE